MRQDLEVTPLPARRRWQDQPMLSLAVGWSVIGLALASTAIGLAVGRLVAIFLLPR